MAHLTKEGSGVVNNAVRHLSFVDSEMVARVVSHSTFRPEQLREPGTTLFIGIPPDQLFEGKSGLLRCWLTALVRVIGAVGAERDSEVLFLLDEAEALNGLPALKEMLIRGRSSGARSISAYQSDSQIKGAFKDQPNLLYDNCSVQIYLGAPSSLETADRLSKTLGDYTQVIESYGENESRSWQPGNASQQGGQDSRSRGNSLNYSESGRALLRPEELLTQSRDRVIVLQSGLPPILANRVKWYADPEFNGAASRSRPPMQLPALPRIECDLFKPFWEASRASIIVRLIAAAILVLILWAMVTGR